MMKVGILTFHRAHNYGAVLQCFALQETIKSLGCDVEIIDYRQRWVEAQYRAFDILYIRNKIKTPKQFVGFIIYFFKRLKKTHVRSFFFDKFKKEHLNVSEHRFVNNKIIGYDKYIIGSDQLWSKDCCGGDFDDVYLGDILGNLKNNVVGYSISTNKKDIAEICELHPSVFYNFRKISFRESFAVDLVNQKIDKRVIKTIDPTLLLPADSWNPLIKDCYSNKNYIALFQVRNPQGKHLLQMKAEHLANVMNCDLINLSNISYSVDDFLSILKYAKCVITSSFHATVFSLLFGTPFYTYKLGDGRDDRYIELLESVDSIDHLVSLDFTPNSPLLVDCIKVNAALDSLRKPSLQYLKQSLDVNFSE